MLQLFSLAFGTLLRLPYFFCNLDVVVIILHFRCVLSVTKMFLGLG